MTRDELESEILKAMLLEASCRARAPDYRGLARAVFEQLHKLGLSLDRLSSPTPRKGRGVPLDRRITLAEEKRQEACTALNMVRRAVEEPGVGLVQFDETVGPEAHHEAEAIIAGIHKLRDRLGRG